MFYTMSTTADARDAYRAKKQQERIRDLAKAHVAAEARARREYLILLTVATLAAFFVTCAIAI